MASGKESVVKVTNSEEKKKALDAAIAKLEKDFGNGCSDEAGRVRGTCVSRDGSDWMPGVWILHWDWGECQKEE